MVSQQVTQVEYEFDIIVYLDEEDIIDRMV